MDVKAPVATHGTAYLNYVHKIRNYMNEWY